MKLLAEINALTGAGYSVGFKPLPYSQGVEIKVGIGGCISSWQLTANAMSGVTEEIVADILEKLVKDISCIRTVTDDIVAKSIERELIDGKSTKTLRGIIEKYKENKHE